MAPRPYWKGYLKLSLVSCPIALTPATSSSEKISFRQVNKGTGNRIRYKKVDAETDEEVSGDDIGKGYEVAKNEYLIMDDEELEAIQLESTHTIEIDQFVPFSQIDRRYYDQPYYIVPNDEVGAEAFAVIREGMHGKAGIGKVALYGREYLVKVQPRERGLIMYTLRHADEIRSMESIDELANVPEKLKPEEVKLARQVMSTFEGDVDFQSYKDEYQEGLRQIIDAKIEGREIVTPEVEAPPKVVNLMDALRKSLDTISASKKKPERIEARPKKRARA